MTTDGYQMACNMFRVTIIDSPAFTIVSAKDETIGGLNFGRNKNISFLPVNVHETFPNLKILFAGSSSIKAITKANFENLNKLEELYLFYNEIEIIGIDVFEDLASIERLDLGEEII